MPKKLSAVKNWDEIPDMISPQDYADVMGCSVKTAYERFNRKDFPKAIDGKVSKSEVRKYLGIKPDNADLYVLVAEMSNEIKKLSIQQMEKIELLRKVVG